MIMIKISTKVLAILFASVTLISCGDSGNSDKSSKNKGSSKVDVCKCLTEPGDSDYMTKNKGACRDAISEAIDVDNWEKVNMSIDRAASARFDKLARRCQVR